MAKNKYIRIIFIFGFLLVSFTSFSQKKRRKGLTLPKLEDTTKSALSYFPVEFKNINKTNYYTDRKKLRTIEKLNNAKKWKELYKPLEIYISNFGIENFRKDTYWLWRYAQLTELNGNKYKSKKVYQLVLKHLRQKTDLKKISIHLDSLRVNEKDYYVSLDHYYELVEFRKQVDTLIPPRGVLLNMGEHVNSEHADYGPTISRHENTLLFTSKRNRVHNALETKVNEDLFFAKGSDGFWGKAAPLKNINTKYNEGSGCLSKDGNTLYFARCNAPDSYGNCDLYVAEMQADSTWGNITNLGGLINSDSWDSQPSLSHTEDTLFFASDRISGFGLSDIYFTYKTKKGNWSKAQNMGPVINTQKNEVSPFYHPKQNVLYFSSNGQLLNFGDYDIYKSYQKENAWSEPLNIGPLVNDKGSEYYFSIDAASKNLYYAKSIDVDLANLDLFSFPLPMGAHPEATARLEGSLREQETDKPLQGIVSIIDLDKGVEVAPKFLRPDGSFSFNLINNNNYLLIIHGEDFFRIEELFYMDGDVKFDRKVNTFAGKLEFESVEFDNGKSEIKTDMFDDLNKIADFMWDHPEFDLTISGHTDSDGDPEANRILSQDRAAAIMEYLTYFGKIDQSRIKAIGHGSSKPIVEETSAENKKLNRRVEFEITKVY